MTCSCACHTTSGTHRPRCTVDTGSSGVPGLPSCTPCENTAPAGAPRCQVCGATTDACLCWSCSKQLEQTIAELPSAIRDLDTTVTRQAKVGNTPRPTETAPEVQQADTEQRKLPARLRSREGRITLPTTVMPVSLGAADLHADAVNAVQTWVRHLAESRGAALPPARITSERREVRRLAVRRNRAVWTTEIEMVDVEQSLSIFALSAWLVHYIDSIRLDEAAGEMHRRLTALREQIDHAVDRHDPDVYAGRCNSDALRVALVNGTLEPTTAICGADLFANEGEDQVTCQTCGATYQMAERREEMRKAVADAWERPHAIANALTSLDEPVKPETLRKWIQRDREAVERRRTEGGRDPAWPLVLQVGIDDEGRALYRVGDVQARIEWVRERSSDRKSA